MIERFVAKNICRTQAMGKVFDAISTLIANETVLKIIILLRKHRLNNLTPPTLDALHPEKRLILIDKRSEMF